MCPAALLRVVAMINGQKWFGLLMPAVILATLGLHSPADGLTTQATGLVWVVKSNRATIAVIDPAINKVIYVVEPRGGVTGDDIAISDGAVWVSYWFGLVHRIDARTRRVVATVQTDRDNRGIAAHGGTVWVGNSDHSEVTRIDRATNRIAGRVKTAWLVRAVAASQGMVWVATDEGRVLRFASASPRVADTIRTDGAPNALAAQGDEVWASDLAFGRVLRIGAGGGVLPIDVGVTNMEGPGLAVGFGAVWVATGWNNTIVRIDAGTNRVLEVIDVGGWAEDVAVGAEAVWVALPEDAEVLRIDPVTNRVIARIRVEGFPNAIAVGR